MLQSQVQQEKQRTRPLTTNEKTLIAPKHPVSLEDLIGKFDSQEKGSNRYQSSPLLTQANYGILSLQPELLEPDALIG